MLFTTPQFVLFFAVVYIGYRLAPTSARRPWLLAASLVFYSLWFPVYILLLLGDLGINYALLRAMLRSARPKLHLTIAIVFTLSLLAYFKYCAFLLENLTSIGSMLGWSMPPGSVDIVLPLGISFYSFQIVALSVDVYRKEIEPPETFARYLLFLTFFPHLIAGPILRGFEFLPQLAVGGRITLDRTRRGLWLIASGLLKKVVFSDFLLSPFVDSVYGSPGSGSAGVHLVATYSFAFQIYFDFSGYTDLARGMAAMLGYDIPLNFTEPYLSRNPAEFWRRWHMTLSRWLRDYLYIPLGGNRGGEARTYVNLFLTMLLGGLWHGAAWNFVVWGGLHGVYLAVHRRFRGRPADADAPLRPIDALKILAMFHAACLLWIFFRAQTFGDAMIVVEKIFSTNYAGEWPVLQTAIVAACFALHGVERVARTHAVRMREYLGEGPAGAVVEGLAFGLIAGLAVAAGGTGAEFIYFQF